jgi:hypothetical protein
MADDLTARPSDDELTPIEAEEEENTPETLKNVNFCDIDPNYRLSNMQCRVIELSLEGHGWSDIARHLNISRQIIWMWKKRNPDFRQALADARADRRNLTAEQCQNSLARTLTILGDIVEDETDKDRMRAAHLIIQAAKQFKPDTMPRFDNSPEYPDPPLITPPPKNVPRQRRPEPELEPKVG